MHMNTPLCGARRHTARVQADSARARCGYFEISFLCMMELELQQWQIAATVTVCGLALLLTMRRHATRASSIGASNSVLGLNNEPGCVACAKGGYSALSAVALPRGAATRGAKAAFDGISDDDCVTVRVCAAGVNYADVCIRWGLYTSWNRFGGGRRPGQDGDEGGIKGDVPGFEFSGTVEKAGKGVNHLTVGDHVFGVSLCA